MWNMAFLVPNPASLHSLHSMVGACSYCSLGNPMPWEPCRQRKHGWLGLGQENSSDPPRGGRQWAGAMGKEGLQGPLLAPRYPPEAGAVSSPGSLLGNGIWASSGDATGGLSCHRTGHPARLAGSSVPTGVVSVVGAAGSTGMETEVKAPEQPFVLSCCCRTFCLCLHLSSR